ncbi:Ohr subfamily peroxiredoxin [Pedobacter cryoconitis]|uniref:Ohr subfamily peroxiredoxin n=1 Tax=Pedobacter cryoconitis TaxID=188932 RepID=A0A7W8YSQ4_9SPHI|nr:organic hydroperoxide resistance protein [Pedobacter cryoconitis]MBB5621123.1 Ohr subfamily peroxiredoxin [Pedobacter cryoconitis]MBB5645565.1 Ohr subfamily peroxiredoxin [Pedobacter cryoconitis]
MEKLYTAAVLAKGGRDGHIKSSDGTIEFEVRTPKEMGGQGGATNPEQLFAAAWGPCYLGALHAVAKNEGVEVADATVNVQVSFNQDGNAYVLSAELDVHIPGLSHEETQKLADKAHKACPYSKATRGNIETRVTAI